MARGYGQPTDELLRKAFVDEQVYGAGTLTMEQRVLVALADGEWHSARELATTVSHRFGGYLHTLKEQGVLWDKRLDPDRPKGKAWWQYRLIPCSSQGNLF